MIKLTVALLGLILLAMAQVVPDPDSPVVGAQTPFSNFSNPGFKRVLDAVIKDYP